MNAGRHLLTALLLVSVTAGACRAAPAPPAGVTSSASGGAMCSLAATGSLKMMTIAAPGPSRSSTTRSYQLYVPKGVGSSGPVPLLVSLHGTGANRSIQSSLTHWTSFADAQAASGSPFIAVFPDGLGTLWLWGAETSYDASFVFDVIAEVPKSSCVDSSAIYVDGWSEGASMAQRMACADGDPAVDDKGVTLAAVHSYAGGNPEVGAARCGSGGRPARTIPVLLSQGLDDQVIDPQRLGFPAFAAWGTRYSCRAPAQPPSAVQQLSGCAAGAAVAWWPIAGQGHLAWSCSADPLWHNRGVWAFLTRREAPTVSTCP